MINKEIELIGVDLDGTLLTDEKTLCPGAEETLKRAKDKGIHIVPITGRPFQGVPECVKALESVDYFICSNGACIIDAKTKEGVYNFSMSNEKSREAVLRRRMLYRAGNPRFLYRLFPRLAYRRISSFNPRCN